MGEGDDSVEAGAGGDGRADGDGERLEEEWEERVVEFEVQYLSVVCSSLFHLGGIGMLIFHYLLVVGM